MRAPVKYLIQAGKDKLAQADNSIIPVDININLLKLTAVDNATKRSVFYLIDLECCLGRGSFGGVYILYKVNDDNTVVDTRLVVKISENKVYASRQEGAIAHLHYPIPDSEFPLQQKDFFFQDRVTKRELHIIVMLFISDYPLNQYREHLSHYKLSTKAFLALQLLQGLQRIHEGETSVPDMAVIHGDLKPDNVLLIEDKNSRGRRLNIGICDFGLAQPIAGSNKAKVSYHPRYSSHIAPEMAQQKIVTTASDVFMIVACLGCIFGGANYDPYQRRNSIINKLKAEGSEAITNAIFNVPFNIPKLSDLEEKPFKIVQRCVKLFLLKMQAPDPINRPDVNTAVQFFKLFNAFSEEYFAYKICKAQGMRGRGAARLIALFNQEVILPYANALLFILSIDWKIIFDAALLNTISKEENYLLATSHDYRLKLYLDINFFKQNICTSGVSACLSDGELTIIRDKILEIQGRIWRHDFEIIFADNARGRLIRQAILTNGSSDAIQAKHQEISVSLEHPYAYLLLHLLLSPGELLPLPEGISSLVTMIDSIKSDVEKIKRGFSPKSINNLISKVEAVFSARFCDSYKKTRGVKGFRLFGWTEFDKKVNSDHILSVEEVKAHASIHPNSSAHIHLSKP